MLTRHASTRPLERRDNHRIRGFTLLELMVVLAILALLASVAGLQVMKYLRHAKTGAAHVQVEALAGALNAFNLDMQRYPTNEEGLTVLVEPPAARGRWDGPYVQKRSSLIDPWGRPYRYKIPGRSGDFDVYTLGSDDREGGEDEAQDVGNW